MTKCFHEAKESEEYSEEMGEGHQKGSQPLTVRSPELVRKHQYVFLSCVHLISLFKRKISGLSHRGPRQREGSWGVHTLNTVTFSSVNHQEMNTL